MTVICKDTEFFAWVRATAPVVMVAERTRLFGTWCPCHDSRDRDGRSAECSMRSRRMHEACNAVDEACKEWQQYRDMLNLESCMGFGSLIASTVALCSMMIAGARLKFKWLWRLPYLFANCCFPNVAEEILKQWEQTPMAQHHRVTKILMQVLESDIAVVAAGGHPTECPAHS
eukprot:4626137-Heterocapsa_arctica.AAC.2